MGGVWRKAGVARPAVAGGQARARVCGQGSRGGSRGVGAGREPGAERRLRVLGRQRWRDIPRVEDDGGISGEIESECDQQRQVEADQVLLCEGQADRTPRAGVAEVAQPRDPAS